MRNGPGSILEDCALENVLMNSTLEGHEQEDNILELLKMTQNAMDNGGHDVAAAFLEMARQAYLATSDKNLQSV